MHTWTSCRLSPKETSPGQHERLHIEAEQRRAHIDPASSLIGSNNRPQRLRKIHNKTSLGVQSLSTKNTIQSSIPSSALGTSGESPSPQIRRSNLPDQTAKASRLKTAWRTEENRPRRFKAHANMCKELHYVKEPRTFSTSLTDRGRPLAEDIANLRKRLEELKAYTGNSDPSDKKTHTCTRKAHEQSYHVPTTADTQQSSI